MMHVDLWCPFERGLLRARERTGGPAGHMAAFCNAAPGCRSVCRRPWHERVSGR
ncbi:MAG TPA: hypothetical protein VGQ26_07145 [Streptosporangiaceae bacterium]|nr:hypothetical protein [Streptosporangiaceae bacterium]